MFRSPGLAAVEAAGVQGADPVQRGPAAPFALISILSRAPSHPSWAWCVPL